MARRPLRLLWVAIAIALLMPAIALGDADPASDILIGANVFYPYNPTVSANLQKTLNAETEAAARARFHLKVALIASPTDLGAIPSFFGKPQPYADYLDQEISFQGKQPLLVVMANGYGVQGVGAAAAGATLTKPTGRDSDDLARAAIADVKALAAATGHPIKVAALPASKGSGHGSTTLILVAVALAAIAAAGSVITVRNRQPRGFVATFPSARANRRRGAAGRSGVALAVPQPRVLVAALLIAGGVVWAAVRGLHFYGTAPIDIGYDLDQPPVLVVLVGVFFLWRALRK
jgi:hypothetical protein